MNIYRELSDLKTLILGKVTEAVSNRDLSSVVHWSAAAEKCERLIREREELEKQVGEFKEHLDKNSSTPLSDSIRDSETKTKRKEISAKLEGKIFRDKFVDALAKKGVQLVGYGKRYQTSKGKRVGVAFANELPYLENKWFLGLKDEPTEVVVLVCRSINREIYDIVLPVDELASKWQRLSRSKGQIKFNVCKDGGDFLLLIPGDKPVIVNKYLRNYNPLQ